MNDKELKQKVFALYWGQKVLKVTPNQTEIVGKGGWNLSHPDFYIEVTTLSQISDEDAIEVAKINGELKFPTYNINITIQAIKEALIEAIQVGSLHMPIEMIDYLRSKGYALPAFGYSVEQLIEKLIFKLKII